MAEPIYELFLGEWVLDVASCEYQQGEPPIKAECSIKEVGGELVFDMNWTDVDHVSHQMSFKGLADGVPAPFDGGALADALTITAVSTRELNSAASLNGVVLMSAIRRLTDDFSKMAILQEVKLPDGEVLANKSIYIRR